MTSQNRTPTARLIWEPSDKTNFHSERFEPEIFPQLTDHSWCELNQNAKRQWDEAEDILPDLSIRLNPTFLMPKNHEDLRDFVRTIRISLFIRIARLFRLENWNPTLSLKYLSLNLPSCGLSCKEKLSFCLCNLDKWL